jgi:type I restriction-modification system DNA methylase subunit
MHWTEPATSDDSHVALEKTLWDAANQLWAGAALKPSEYSPTVLGLIFLRQPVASVCDRRTNLCLTRHSRRSPRKRFRRSSDGRRPTLQFPISHLLSLPEGANVGQAVNDAMRAIEKENPDLADVLPKSYHILESRTLASLLKTMASISMDKAGGSKPDSRHLSSIGSLRSNVPRVTALTLKIRKGTSLGCGIGTNRFGGLKGTTKFDGNRQNGLH